MEIERNLDMPPVECRLGLTETIIWIGQEILGYIYKLVRLRERPYLLFRSVFGLAKHYGAWLFLGRSLLSRNNHLRRGIVLILLNPTPLLYITESDAPQPCLQPSSLRC